MDDKRARIMDQLLGYLEELDATGLGRELAGSKNNAMPKRMPSEDEAIPEGGSVRMVEAEILPEGEMAGGASPGPMESLSGEPGLDMDEMSEEDLMELEALAR